ncbi:hypothetical protein SH584_11315 [Sphingomonas sp. LY29]|uniref:hypothetical protein n=1 Tax=Sphingomonas sp. LY29 TaxID=3095341 RepID=UPI002D79DE94|nr:hypothetical protein [Sphingomonas sp. LY29]WRP25620.1 hypothetical protein SH584_11315 [Sphingomonas sp. LY29]
MNELVAIREAAPVDNYRMSTDAASVCKEIVVATSSNIQGRKYVSVEGWQAIAIAHGCAAGSGHVERVDGGVRAVGEVRRMSDGQLIATAEGFVGEDEPTWFGGQSRGKTLPKRADYAIRAMAQTRAISRACRSAFAHVVVMMNAGLQTTPAEEVPTSGFDDVQHNPQTGEVIEREKVPGITKIKDRLGKMMTAGNAMTDLADFKALVKANRDDIKTIRDANHQWWTGDGDDWEGFGKWLDSRYAALTPVEESVGFQMLMSVLSECATRDDLASLVDQHGNVIEELDGEESRKWDEAYNGREVAIAAVAPLGAG